MQKVLFFMMCIFGFQSPSHGFLGTALNTESEKAFLKSLETHSGVTDEQSKALLLKAAHLQERLSVWSDAGVGITSSTLIIILGWVLKSCLFRNDGSFGSMVCTIGNAAPVLSVCVLAVLGLGLGKSNSSSVRAKERARTYKKMAEKATQIKAYQRYTERLGFMGGFDEKNRYSSTWNTIAQGRQKVMKKGFNAQLVGTSLGALGAFISAVFFCKGPNRYNFLSVVAFAAFTLFSAYGLKGVARKQAMKKLMSEMKNEYSGARAIAQDPEAELLKKIAEWEQKEAAVKTQVVV
jgi:hypothetical protein